MACCCAAVLRNGNVQTKKEEVSFPNKNILKKYNIKKFM